MLVGSAAAPRFQATAGRHRSTLLQRHLQAFAAWRRRRRERAELSALSDAALKDFGISWTEIEAIVSSDNRDASGRLR